MAHKLNSDYKCFAQSGASEYLILNQVEEAVKLKPDLIIVGHTSEYRWKVWDFRKNQWQGFLVANHILKNKKYYRNWVFSEQILSNKRKHEKQHQAAWHAAGMLYYSDEQVAQELWEGAVAKQIILCEKARINHIHLSCFPHLYANLCNLTDKHIPFHLDSMKHTDFAKDKSHAGSASHLKIAQALYNLFAL